MTEEAKEPTVRIDGRQCDLPNGAKVWGGLKDGGVVWKFTSRDGAVTTLSLSDLAMHAVIQIYQGLMGCDPEFAAVSVGKESDDPELLPANSNESQP